MKNMVKTRSVLVGATREARRLGVGYQYLWKVLTGASKSPSLVLKIRRLRPSLFCSPICRIPWRKICEENEGKYYWSSEEMRYRIKYDADGRRMNGKEARLGR